jgi:hypothetical protein
MVVAVLCTWGLILAFLRVNKSDEEEFDEIINKMIKK